MGVEVFGAQRGAFLVAEETVGLLGLHEEALDFEAELGVVPAFLGEKRLALRAGELVSPGEEVFGVGFQRHLRETRVYEVRKGPPKVIFFEMREGSIRFAR